MLIALTGPTGSGKSTVAKALCQKFDKCVRLDVDRVKHFVVSGFLYDESMEGKKQWELCSKNVVDLAKNFYSEDYTVLIEGFFSKEEWEYVFAHLPETKPFLLLPNESVIIKRDKSRDPKWAMGEVAVQEHLKEFENSFYDDFNQINSSDTTVDETVEMICTYLYRVT